MTIYVLRSDNLMKIGFTDDLRQRVQSIIATVPVPVEFVGAMPGGREVERHLHDRFASHRFSGEWFVETPEMRSAFDLILTPGLPAAEEKPKTQKRRRNDSNEQIKDTLRDVSARLWPRAKHRERIENAATELGWNVSRVRDFYYGDPRAVIRDAEAKEFDAFYGALDRSRIGRGR